MKTRLIAISGALAAITLLPLVPLYSGEGGDVSASQEKMFHALDANGDGKVTEKEFVITGLHEIFRSFDLDGSEKVSRAEFMKVTKSHQIDHEAEWAAMSRGAGEITFKDSLRNEVAISEMQAHFRKVDKSGKGYVTLADLD